VALLLDPRHQEATGGVAGEWPNARALLPGNSCSPLIVLDQIVLLEEQDLAANRLGRDAAAPVERARGKLPPPSSNRLPLGDVLLAST
jgi:hypothetical protein